MSPAELLLVNSCCVAHFIVLGSPIQVLTDATDFRRFILCISVKSVRLRSVTFLKAVPNV